MTKPKARVAVTDEQIEAARLRARQFQVDGRPAARVMYEKKPDLVTLHLDDGVRISIPRGLLEGLQDASPAQLAKVEFLGRGTGIRWPLLDVDRKSTRLNS